MIRTANHQPKLQKLRRVKGKQIKPCVKTHQVFCPRHPIDLSDPTYCYASYGCENKSLSLDCTPKNKNDSLGNKTLYECICDDFKGNKTIFVSEEICPSKISDVAVTKWVNAKCGWNIWIPEMVEEE
jgi:hypothetical protein